MDLCVYVFSIILFGVASVAQGQSAKAKVCIHQYFNHICIAQVT